MRCNVADIDLAAVFTRLRAILQPYADRLIVTSDTEDNYYLDTAHIMPNGKPLFFAAVRRGKAYVSYYLMPVYAFPELLGQASPSQRLGAAGTAFSPIC